MTKTLDVYRDWLKIADADRPLNHYQLDVQFGFDPGGQRFGGAVQTGHTGARPRAAIDSRAI